MHRHDRLERQVSKNIGTKPKRIKAKNKAKSKRRRAAVLRREAGHAKLTALNEQI